jgi:hypothetical protein
MERSRLLRRTVVLGLGAAGAALATGAARADQSPAPLPPPKGNPILSISGKITVHNAGTKALFDMAAIESLGLTGFTTATPWTKKTDFQGVLLDTLLKRVGAHDATTAITYALNDYVVEIPLKTPPASADGPLMATRMNGQFMPVKQFGPLFVVYNFDKHSEWLNNAMYARCIWQLQRMTIV